MLDLLIGTAVAVLSGMGVGSGGLLVVYLTLAGGIAQPAAQALNLFFFIFAAYKRVRSFVRCQSASNCY